MSDFYERLCDEHAALTKKLYNLNEFLRTTAFVELSPGNQILLKEQAYYMERYHAVLTMRKELCKNT